MVDREALLRLARALPDGTAMPVPCAWILELLEATETADAGTPGGRGGGGVPGGVGPVTGGKVSADSIQIDLTAEQVGAALHRSPITVRTYCSSGLIPGAYRWRGRQWRIPRSALEAFQKAERKAHDTNTKRRPAA